MSSSVAESAAASASRCAASEAPCKSEEATDSLLILAIYIAAGAHNSQIDRGGAPYIHHPMRVMMAMETAEEKVVAVLHDVLEDCPDWTAQRLLHSGIPAKAVEAVICLTRRPDETYEQFIERVAKNPLAARVKIADLADNMDLTRIPNPGHRDRLRVEKYERARALLRARSQDGTTEQSSRPREAINPPPNLEGK
jgi:(p)ppGpp synthase/HD superfamily hydrolase